MPVKPVQVTPIALLLSPVIAAAVVMTSASYSILSSDLNSGGGYTSSANYSTRYSLGQVAAGSYSSAGYQVSTAVLSATDTDNDLIPDLVDNCRFVINAGQLNSDADPLGNACDLDDDNDGLSDVEEGTLGTNPLLADTDSDGFNDNIDPYPLMPNVIGDLAPYGAPDGIINTGDLVILKRIVLGLVTPTAGDIFLGDLYPDGELNISDLIVLKQMLLQ